MFPVEINVLEWFSNVSPSMVGFEVCVLFQAHQQDCSVFYETDLFLCGLWLSSHSDSLANEEWGQAKGHFHGCPSQDVNMHSHRATEHICVYAAGCLAWVPNLPYMASFASNKNTLLLLWSVPCRRLGWVTWWVNFLYRLPLNILADIILWCENSFHLAS